MPAEVKEVRRQQWRSRRRLLRVVQRGEWLGEERKSSHNLELRSTVGHNLMYRCAVTCQRLIFKDLHLFSVVHIQFLVIILTTAHEG